MRLHFKTKGCLTIFDSIISHPTITTREIVIQNETTRFFLSRHEERRNFTWLSFFRSNIFARKFSL